MLLENAQGAEWPAALAEAAQMSAPAPEPFARYVGAFLGGCGALARGDIARAEGNAGLALATGQALGQPDAQHWHRGKDAFIRWAQGRLNEVLGGHRMIAADLPLVTSRAAELAYVEATVGDRVRAQALLDSLGEAKFATFYGPPWLGTTCLWAAARACTDRAAAATSSTACSGRGRTCSPPQGRCRPRHGMLPRRARRPPRQAAAADHLHDALNVHDKAETPFGSALTHLALSELNTQGRAAGAPTRHARAALEIAQEHGFEAIRARAAELVSP